MKFNRIVQFVPAFAAVLMAVTLVALAAGVGSKEDPLVTLSYLEGTYTDTLLKKADETLQQRNSELESSLKAQVDRLAGSGGTSASTYQVITLSKGQSLKGTVGTEVMLRVGTAGCYAASSPGLIDTTDGTDLAGGKALVKNHLYLMTVEGRAVQATADTVKLLVRGSYTIG